ncbi:hypothetical protein LguiB_009370 [Lonicera macranthoides]
MPQFYPAVSTSRPRTTDPEGSKALIHVFSEWGVAQGLSSPSKSFRDNLQNIFLGIILRIVNEENALYKPHRRSGKNYTRRYPSKQRLMMPDMLIPMLVTMTISAYQKGKMFREAEALLKQIQNAGLALKDGFSSVEVTTISKSDLAECLVREMSEKEKVGDGGDWAYEGPWPRTTDLEDSEALVHVSSEWGVAQGLGSASRSFGDNPQDIFPGMTLRIVNEENTSYKPHRHSGKNYTRRYPSRVIMTISSPTTSRGTHQMGK